MNFLFYVLFLSLIGNASRIIAKRHRASQVSFDLNENSSKEKSIWSIGSVGWVIGVCVLFFSMLNCLFTDATWWGPALLSAVLVVSGPWIKEV